MAVVDHEGLDRPVTWAALGLQRAEPRPVWMLPSGWWVVPGVVLGFGMWVLIGIGIHAAFAGGGDAADIVTMAAPMAGGGLTVD